MQLCVDVEDFVIKDFVILNFYGKPTCFGWNGDEFVCFPYSYKNATEELKVRKAPGKINNIREFNERVFILCTPSGIYKLTENLEFAVLSRAGIELGSDYHEVFTPLNGCLTLEDKISKVSKRILNLTSSENLNVLPLKCENTDPSLFKVLLPSSSSANANMCLITYEKNTFKICGKIAQIIYSCDHVIRTIQAVQKNDKIFGAVIQTDSNVVILMHVVKSELKFEKIFLKEKVETLFAMLDITNSNSLLLVHSYDRRTYYSKKILMEDSCQVVRIQEIFYHRIRLYQSKFIIYLNDHNELFQYPIEKLMNAHETNPSDYVKLEYSMLRGLERTVETICEKSLELQKLKKQMMEKEDELKRINLFVNKQHLRYCPRDSVMRFLTSVFLVSDFQNTLPENCIIVRMLKSRGKTVFTMKKTHDFNTVVEMPINASNLSAKLYTTTDLITYKQQEGIWCLIKNYVRDPPSSQKNKIHMSKEKLDFVKYKMVVLRNMMKDNQVTMEALSRLKREIREELQEHSPS